ncbi:hypothetical protein ACFYOI_04200 [Streptomyces microflavus]
MRHTTPVPRPTRDTLATSLAIATHIDTLDLSISIDAWRCFP